MAITADLNGKNYTLGRGKVFFNPYPANTPITSALKGLGRRYLGNTPSFSMSQATEDLDHFDSDAGVKVKDDSVQLSQDRTGTVTTDNIDKANLALLFQGSAGSVTQVSATGVVETFVGRRARFIQLGQSPSNPSGARNIAAVVVKKGVAFADTVTMTGNYEVDPVSGQIYIESDAPDISEETPLQITYNVGASTRGQVISGSNSIYGELFFKSDNPKGSNRDYLFPYVKMAPDGDYNLKGDDWQTIGFAFEVLKKGSLEAIYIDEQPVTP